MGPFRGQNNSRGRGGGRGGRGGGGGGRGGRGGPRFGGPKLPSTLIAEVDSSYGKNRRAGSEMTRKDQRKAARQEKRAGPSRQVYAEASDKEEEEVDEDEPAPPPKLSKKAQGKRPAQEEEEKPKKKRKLPELTLPGADQVDVEDDEIEWLEWMLRKEKAKAKEDDLDDGLDDILDFADIIGPGGRGLQVDDDNDDDELDLSGLGEDSDLEASKEDDESDEEEDSGDSDEDEEADRDDDAATDPEDQSDEGDAASVNFDDEEPWNGIVDTPASPVEQAAPAAEPTKYIPPHMRAAALAEKAAGDAQKIEERRKLERKTQGLLNKLSEANIESILVEAEGLYRDHSRNDVTTTLTGLILQMISSRSNLLDSFVILYATMVGALHRIIGLEFGAHFVHTLVTRYHELSSGASSSQLAATIYETPDASKEALNLLTLIAELYNAGVIGSGLIYDLIRGFLASGTEEEVMAEKEVEALLKVLRCSGPQLRSDDPASLKDIVGIVQDKTKGKEKTMTTRARFMVETLVNVKNGKGKTGNGAEQSSDAAARMKRFLSGLGRKRRLLASEPLRVSLADLLSADKKGKWWLVGAGWSGNPLVEREQASLQKPKKAVQETSEEEALLDLARKQGMNTDVRRSVFVVLMTSEDYMHACDRLNQLRFTDVQQREFVRVALHCCGLEKRYNPYYTLVLNNLCAESYDHRFTLQYALWDFLRELGGEGSKETRRKGVNVAKAMAYVVGRGSLDLTVFKAVEWTELNSATTTFLINTLIHLLLATQTVSPLFALPKTFNIKRLDDEAMEEVFEKALVNGELAQGWGVVIRTELGPKKLDRVLESLTLGETEVEVVRAGLEIARGVLARAI